MKLEGGTHVVQSYAGSLCSILFICITLLYAVQKMVVLVEKKDIDVLSTTLDSFYDEHYVFSYQNGFNIAVAFTGFNNVAEMELDPSYGKFRFSAY